MNRLTVAIQVARARPGELAAWTQPVQAAIQEAAAAYEGIPRAAGPMRSEIIRCLVADAHAMMRGIIELAKAHGEAFHLLPNVEPTSLFAAISKVMRLERRQVVTRKQAEARVDTGKAIAAMFTAIVPQPLVGWPAASMLRQLLQCAFKWVPEAVDVDRHTILALARLGLAHNLVPELLTPAQRNQRPGEMAFLSAAVAYSARADATHSFAQVYDAIEEAYKEERHIMAHLTFGRATERIMRRSKSSNRRQPREQPKEQPQEQPREEPQEQAPSVGEVDVWLGQVRRGECPICLAAAEERTCGLGILTCTVNLRGAGGPVHVVCDDCLCDWQSDACPVCRQPCAVLTDEGQQRRFLEGRL